MNPSMHFPAQTKTPEGSQYISPGLDRGARGTVLPWVPTQKNNSLFPLRGERGRGVGLLRSLESVIVSRFQCPNTKEHKPSKQPSFPMRSTIRKSNSWHLLLPRKRFNPPHGIGRRLP